MEIKFEKTFSIVKPNIFHTNQAARPINLWPHAGDVKRQFLLNSLKHRVHILKIEGMSEFDRSLFCVSLLEELFGRNPIERWEDVIGVTY